MPPLNTILPALGRLRTTLPTVLLICACLAANALVALMAYLALEKSRAQYEQQAIVTTQNLAAVLQEAVGGAFLRIDLTLNALTDLLERQLAVYGQTDRRIANMRVDTHMARLPELEAIRIFDADGVFIVGPLWNPDQPQRIGDIDWFRAHRANPDSGLIISPPVVGRISGRWVISASRRYNNPDGSFAGVAIASLPVDHFVQMFAQFQLGPHGIVALRDADLRIVARWPQLASPAGAIGSDRAAEELRDLLRSDR